MDPSWFPSVPLALAAAMLFGVSVVVARMGLAHTHPRSGAWLSIVATTVFFLGILPFYPRELGAGEEFLPTFIGLFILLGLFTPGLSLFLAFEGHHRLGPTISGTLASTSPLFAAGAAVAVLGEQVSLDLATGTLAVVAGVMTLSWQGRAVRDWRWWALMFPLGAAFLRGIVSMGTRYGMGLAPAPFAAALIASSTALVMLPLLSRVTSLSLPMGGVRRGLKWFLLAGVLNGLATVSFYTALLHGQVVTVSPITASFPVFTFIASMTLGLDRLSLRIAVGVTLVVGGVIAISLA